MGQADYVTEENILTAVNDYIQERDKRETMREALEEHNIINGVERIKQILFNESNEN